MRPARVLLGATKYANLTSKHGNKNFYKGAVVLYVNDC